MSKAPEIPKLHCATDLRPARQNRRQCFSAGVEGEADPVRAPNLHRSGLAQPADAASGILLAIPPAMVQPAPASHASSVTKLPFARKLRRVVPDAFQPVRPGEGRKLAVLICIHDSTRPEAMDSLVRSKDHGTGRAA